MVYVVYFVVIWRIVYALTDLVSRLAVVVIFWLFVYIFVGMDVIFLDRYCIYGWFLLDLCSYAVEIFPAIKKKMFGVFYYW